MASSAKIVVESLIHGYGLRIGSLCTTIYLHIIHLGSYDIVLGMGWLEAHRAFIDCCHKLVQCVDDSGSEVEVIGVQRPISLRMISAMQLRRCMQHGFQLFAVTVNDLELGESREVSLDSHPILR